MVFENLKVGLKNSAASIVEVQDTAAKVGSGSLEVLASPKMFALIEKAAADLLEKNLPQEYTSVGTLMNVEHIAPTPVGMKFSAEVKIISIEGRKIIFEVAASDEVEKIGRGVHERFIVGREKFLSKANAKLA